MYKKFPIYVFLIFILSVLSLSFFWHDVERHELYSDTPVVSVYRHIQNLSGKWEVYPTVREAWTRENKEIKGDQNRFLSLLNSQQSIILPSDKGFRVAVKHFKVSGEWGSKTAQLVLSGVNGKVRLFLNGIEEVHFLGEYEGSGGTCSFDISSARLDFNNDNTLYIEMSPGSIKQKMMLGRLWPEQGGITGEIRLEAVPETTIDIPQITVRYNADKKQAVVGVTIKHHQTLAYEPWALSGVIRDKEQPVAECLLPLNANGDFTQRAELIFDIPQVKLWSLETPFLYELELVLTNSRGDTDKIQLPAGFAVNSADSETWKLNDKTIEVKASILTKDSEAVLRNTRQVESFLASEKARGINVISFTGFFPDETWLNAADRAGMGVWLEMPLSFTAAGRIPPQQEFQELIVSAERHPSVLAWTAAKGLQPSREATEYLRSVRDRLSYLPVYNMVLFSSGKPDEIIILNKDGLIDELSGTWGNAGYPVNINSDTSTAKNLWPGQKAASIAWLVWLILLSVQNLRASNWRYGELFNKNMRRGVRRSLFWRCLYLISRYATFAGVITSLLFRIPLKNLFLLPYDTGWLESFQSQSPLLIWISVSAFLLLLRLFSSGLASPYFPDNPGAAGLSCWLEKRYNGILLVGIAWVMLSFSTWWFFIPLAVYLLLSVIMIPLKIRYVRRAGGKYTKLMILPVSIFVIVLLIILWNYQDIMYLFSIINTLFLH